MPLSSPVAESVPQTDALQSTNGRAPILMRSTPLWKRMMDLVGVSLLLPILLPILLLVSLYIKLVSRGPVFFVQQRLGHGGKPFAIYKFRTMQVPDRPRDQEHREYLLGLAEGKSIQKPDHSCALIPGGGFLRRTSIDELPQLLNVLRGNMSLVGPRPDLLLLSDYEDWQLRRFEVAPGITGLWQVSGKNNVSFEQMMRLDIQYVNSLAPSHDVKIILRTFRVLFIAKNE